MNSKGHEERRGGGEVGVPRLNRSGSRPLARAVSANRDAQCRVSDGLHMRSRLRCRHLRRCRARNVTRSSAERSALSEARRRRRGKSGLQCLRAQRKAQAAHCCTDDEKHNSESPFTTGKDDVRRAAAARGELLALLLALRA